jgi:hypothetical protein
MSRSKGQGVPSVERDDDAFASAIDSLIFPVSQTAGFDFSALPANGRLTAFSGLQDLTFRSPHPGPVTDAVSTSSTLESADITVQPLEAGALTFALHNIGGVTPGSQAEAGFQRAAALWQSFLGDPVTVRLDVGFSSLGPGILGSTGSTSHVVSYSAVRAALTADKSSSDDAAAVASLSPGSSLAFFTNNSAGTRIFDNDGSANNTFLSVNTADLKALGITTDANGQPTDTGAADGSITFSSNFTWDFDPSDGITPGAIDFVGVAVHEIGHALGFVSGVDVNDFNTGAGPGGQVNLNPFAVYSVLDLFRYSANGVRDLSFGGSTYFSLNGGATNLALFSTGAFQGDGRQASHWKDNLGIGIMDPTSVPAGQANVITSRDIQALDVIGWNLSGLSPAPGSISINDVQISEGNTGSKVETFTVTRSGGAATAFDVFYNTADGSATTADNDYVTNVGILHFDASVNTQTISVTIRGDTKFESDETFFVNLLGPSNGIVIADGQGVGTILNDDPGIFASTTFRLAAFAPGVSGWDSDNHYPRELADINHDGMADIVGFGEAGVYESLATGGGAFGPLTFKLAAFGNSSGGWSSEDRYPRELADINHDGMADIVGFGEAGVYVSLATGGGNFGPLSFQLSAFGNSSGGWSSEDKYPRELADVNGDGMADIVGFGEAGVYVSLATGGGAFGPLTFKLAAFGNSSGGWDSENHYPRQLADVNGDGMADIVGFGEAGVYVSLATGGGSFGPLVLKLAAFSPSTSGWTSNDQFPRELADVNLDGKIDIVGFGQNNVFVAFGNGDGSFKPVVLDTHDFTPGANGWTSEDHYPRLLADVNHDGAADIVGFGQNGVFEALSNGFHLI